MIFLIKELHFSREKKFINICSNLQRAAVQMCVTPTTVRLVSLILQLENLNGAGAYGVILTRIEHSKSRDFVSQ